MVDGGSSSSRMADWGGGSAGPAGASSNHSSDVGLEGSAGSVGQLSPEGGARGKMISQAGGVLTCDALFVLDQVVNMLESIIWDFFFVCLSLAVFFPPPV